MQAIEQARRDFGAALMQLQVLDERWREACHELERAYRALAEALHGRSSLTCEFCSLQDAG